MYTICPSSRNFRTFILASAFFFSLSFDSAICQTLLQGLPSLSKSQHLQPDSKTKRSTAELFESVKRFKTKSLIPASSVTLSLEDSVKTALTRNPELLAALSSAREFGFLYTAEKNTWYPTFSVGSTNLPGYQYDSSYLHQKDTSYPTPESITISRTGTISTDTSSAGTASIDASLRWIFLDPARQPSINNFADQYGAQKYVLVSTVRQLLSNIQILYVDLQAQRLLVDSYSEVVNTLADNVKYFSARQKIGLASTLDVAQSESQLYNSLSQLVTSIQAYNDASDRLAALISLPSGSLIVPTDQLTIDAGWDLPLESSVQSAINNNDSILQTLLLASASRWQGFYYLNQTLPQFSLNLATGYSPTSTLRGASKTEYGENSSAGTNSSSAVWKESYNVAAFLGFSWNIFQGGVNTSNAASQFARSEAFNYNVQNQRNQLTASVRSNYSSLEATSLSLESSEEAIRSSYEAYRAAKARASIGLADTTTINQTIQSYQSALQARTASLQQYNTSLALLYKDTAIWPKNLEAFAVSFLSRNLY